MSLQDLDNQIQALSSTLEDLKNQRITLRLLKYVGITDPMVEDLRVCCSYTEEDNPIDEYYLCIKADLTISYQYKGRTRQCCVHFIRTSPDENGNRYQSTTNCDIGGTQKGPIFDELFEDPPDWEDFIKKLAA